MRLIILSLIILCSSLHATYMLAYRPLVIASGDGRFLYRISNDSRNSKGNLNIYKYEYSEEKGYLESERLDSGLKTQPDLLVVSEKGDFIVLLDEWQALGRGEYAISVYSKDGSVLLRRKLSDIYSTEQIKQFAYSSRWIMWRGGVEFVWESNTVQVLRIKPGMNPRLEPFGKALYLHLATQPYLSWSEFPRKDLLPIKAQ